MWEGGNGGCVKVGMGECGKVAMWKCGIVELWNVWMWRCVNVGMCNANDSFNAFPNGCRMDIDGQDMKLNTL